MQETPKPSPIAPALCPNMVAIASGKGGVGKTWFAATLCHALAKKGRRVLLFDGDVGLANIDIQLGITPKRDLSHVIEGGVPLQGAVTRFEAGGFDVVAGRSGSGNLANISLQSLAMLRNALVALAKDYHHVIIDLSAGIDRAVRLMAGPAAQTLVVLTDEPTSLTDAYAYIKVTLAATPEAKLGIVVNMAATAQEGRKTYDAIAQVCKKFLQYTPPLLGIIRRDAKVGDTIRAQAPLLERYPSCDAADDIAALVNAFMNYTRFP